MKKITLLISLALVLLLTGCKEFEDGYQFGDVTRFTERELNELERARQDYCDQNRDKFIRQAALAYLRSQVPGIPSDGICGYPFTQGKDSTDAPVFNGSNIKARDDPG